MTDTLAPPRRYAAVTTGAVDRLVAAVHEVSRASPVELPGPLALADARALLGTLEHLHAVVLGRLADVDRRQLFALAGAPSSASWVAAQPSSLDRTEVALARRLSSFPILRAALTGQGAGAETAAGTGIDPAAPEDVPTQRGPTDDEDLPLAARPCGPGLAIASARHVAAALAKLRVHCDRSDGLVDGQPGEAIVTAVVRDGVLQLIAEAAGGLADHDLRLLADRASLADIASEPLSQLARLERAFVLLARRLEPGQLRAALTVLTDAVLPGEHERRAAAGHSRRAITLERNPDGSGWTLTQGRLDLECGELLHAVLHAGLTADPLRQHDTDGYAGLRHRGWHGGDPIPAGRSTPEPTASPPPASGMNRSDAPPDQACAAAPQSGDRFTPLPRTGPQRRHDALRDGLRRLLDTGVLGLRDKQAPHLDITVSLTSLHDEPGAFPARSSSGSTLPASLIRRWWCDSAVTRYVLDLGRNVVARSHGGRTLTAAERRIMLVESGHTCQAAGCLRGPAGGVGQRLVPHHVEPWATTHSTSLHESVLICEQTHHEVHSGDRVVTLKDGRRFDAQGWVR